MTIILKSKQYIFEYKMQLIEDINYSHAKVITLIIVQKEL